MLLKKVEIFNVFPNGFNKYEITTYKKYEGIICLLKK